MENHEFQLIVEGTEEGKKSVTIPLGITVIGRSPEVDLRLNETRVSRRHAQIECDGMECYLTDLGSANGTWLNGDKLSAGDRRLLPDRAEVRIGSFKLLFEKTSSATEELKPLSVPESEPKEETLFDKNEVQSSPPFLIESTLHQLEVFPPGLTMKSQLLLPYLPDIYHTDFMSRFLALFESILIPIEWNIRNFDIFLNAGTAPQPFLLWLAQWLDLKIQAGWSESQQRIMLSEAHQLYARRGTPWALRRVLQIYFGEEPEIIDLAKELEPFTFKVILPMKVQEVNREVVEQIIKEFKPVYTTYILEFKV